MVGILGTTYPTPNNVHANTGEEANPASGDET
jgi:hypothetical protein